jgi:predicted  nucleic acid-binding Zn-ribbon protein
MSKLGEIASRLEPKLDDGDRTLLVQTAECEAARTEAMQAEHQRIGKIEDQVSELRVAMASASGRMDSIKTGIEGELKLFHQMLLRLDEKVALIERNTSHEQSSRRTWRIALIAAVPGVVSVTIRIIELLSSG